MVGIRRHVVFDQGRGPQLGEAEAGDVVEAVDRALDVAAVAPAGLLAVGLFQHAGDAVVGWIAVGEAVRHDLVDGVTVAEPLAHGGTRLACAQLIRVAQGCAVAREHDVEAAGFRLRRDLEIDEQVIGVRDPGSGGDAHARVVDGRLQLADARPMHHQLHAAVAHAGPPEGRFQVFDGRRGDGRRQASGGEEKCCKRASHGRTRLNKMVIKITGLGAPLPRPVAVRKPARSGRFSNDIDTIARIAPSWCVCALTW
jgi:hypothetical protein